MGNLTSGTFTEGAIAITVDSLEAGGSSGLRVDIVDVNNNNTRLTTTATVTFSSPCAGDGSASITSPVTTSNGTATSTYLAQGCAGDDLITASATVGGVALTSTGTITVAAAPANSIQFVSSTPNTIGLRGSGQADTAQVAFRVLNSAGGPVPNQDVLFQLNTQVGGIALSPTTGTTDSTGLVQATVNSGTVATAVRVTATLLDNPITAEDESLVPAAQSDSLVISTGIADQDSFSLSIGCFNIEGGNFDGTETNVNIRAADRFNNPVPDGTGVSFIAEGGVIEPRCFTTNGACTVTFTSQDPRPADRRVSILATAIGEESFLDTNGDGRFTAGEPFADIGEAFLDFNENSAFDSGVDTFLDFNSNSSRDGASGNFTGVLCDSGCDTANSLHVRDTGVIIMSGSNAVIDFAQDPVDLSNGAVAVTVLIGDSVGQPMPGGTTIEASTTLGEIVGESERVQACTTFNGPIPYTFVVAPPEGGSQTSGVMTVKVTTPESGTTTAASVSVVRDAVVVPPPPPSDVGSIEFVSATPTEVGIRGTGLPDTSTVVFRVRSETGEAVESQTVNFSLSTSTGGITLNPVSDETDENGLVRTIVKSGTVHTSVRVSGSTLNGSGNTISATSEQLTISTGIPDQDSFSLVRDCANPEGLQFDGETALLTIRAADRFNNPAPDGTAVAFTTEGGSVEPSCRTVNGACSVIWTSQNPRPDGLNNCDQNNIADLEDDSLCSVIGSRGAARPGRATVLATAIGEESFTDLNGNGRYDDGEPLTNLGEAFRDDDGDGTYDAAFEEFLDFGGADNDGGGVLDDPNGIRDSANAQFTGVLCDGPNNCDPVTKLHVRETIAIVMSGSTAVIDPSQDIAASGGGYNPATNTLTLAPNEVQSLRFVIRDRNDQPMPAGSAIKLEVIGDGVSLAGLTEYEAPCTADDTAGGNTYVFGVVAGEPDADARPSLLLSVTTGQKVLTQFFVNVFVDVP